MRLYLGVDAGNSKTDALVGDAHGTVVGAGHSGMGDIYGVAAPADAVTAVLTAIADALDEAGAEPHDVARAAFCLAGVDWPEDEAFWAEQITQHLPRLGGFSIRNDGFAPIRCVEPSGVGVAIVAGTGPAVVARGADGTEWSMSFWAHDSMGAGGLVSDALRAVYRSHLGLQPKTLLTDRLLAEYGHTDVEEMLHYFTGRESEGRQHWRPSAAPVVTAAAADGDESALEIVTQHAEHFVDYAWAAARAVGFATETDAVPVVLAGSVVSTTSVLADAIATVVPERLPRARVRVAALPPVAGALLDALAEDGIVVPPEQVRQRR